MFQENINVSTIKLLIVRVFVQSMIHLKNETMLFLLDITKTLLTLEKKKKTLLIINLILLLYLTVQTKIKINIKITTFICR